MSDAALKRRARSAVMVAKAAGRLVEPERCEECGCLGRLEAHHPDYSRALDVQWLCRDCHAAVHGGASIASKVIQDLMAAFGCGSERALAARLHVKPPTVTSWKAAVPAHRWVKIARQAQRENVRLPDSFLAMMQPEGSERNVA